MTDLTKLTLAELRRIAGDFPEKAADEFYRRAQANALVQAERDEFDEELHTCRAIVGATSEHLHVDLEELVDKLRRTEADSRSWQELATARAQAIDALRSDALREAIAYCRSQVESCSRPDPKSGVACGMFDCLAAAVTTDMERHFGLDAAAPAAQPTPAAPVTDAEIDKAIDKLDHWACEYGRAIGEGEGGLPEKKDRDAAVDSLRALIARRVASVGAAPVDSEREAAIEAWIARIVRARVCNDNVAFDKAVADGCSLMRSAQPAPAGDQDAKLREAVESLETVATKQQKVELRDAAYRLLRGYSPCTNCGKWAHGSEGHWPCNPIAPVAAPAASAIAAAPEDKARWIPCPATRDGWICVRHDGHKGAHESVKRTLWPNEACEVCHGAGQVEGTAGVVLGGEPVPAMRLCPECSTSAFERLRTKLAAAPEAPAWREKLDAAAAELDDQFADNADRIWSANGVDEDLGTLRSFVTALREQVESHARRIEALERANNKEAGK